MTTSKPTPELLLVALAALATGGCTPAPDSNDGQVSAIRAPARPDLGIPARASVARPAAPLEMLERAADGHILYRQMRTAAVPDTERAPRFALFLGGKGEPGDAPVRLLPLELVVDARLAPEGGRVAALVAGGPLVVVEPGAAAAAIRTVDVGVLPGLAFSSDGTLLAYSRRDDDPRPELHLHDLSRGESRPVVERDRGPADRPAFSADDAFLFAVGNDAASGMAQLWAFHLASGRRIVVTNQGLSAPTGDGQPPPGFVPLPVGPAPARHQEGQLVYDAGDALVTLPVHLDALRGSAKAGTARIQPVTQEVRR